MDSPIHILFECDALKDMRIGLWGNIVSYMPAAMADHVTTATILDRYEFIITGLKCTSYITEWEYVLGFDHEVLFLVSYTARVK